LLRFGNVNVIQIDQGVEIKALNQQIKGVSEKYEDEAKHLKENITQLKQQLFQQKQEDEGRIQDLLVQSNKMREEYTKEKSENLTKLKRLEQELGQLRVERQSHRKAVESTNEKLRSFQEQIKNLQQEKSSSEQRSKQLEGYIDTTVKEQMKAYENQIKTLGDKIEAEKKMAAEYFEINLQRVMLDLALVWGQWFSFEVYQGILKISTPHKLQMSDQIVNGLSRDLLKTLPGNQSIHLVGLKILLDRCENLTDQALNDMAKVISKLQLQHLTMHFVGIPSITDIGLEYLVSCIEYSGKDLQELFLDFSWISTFSRNKVTNIMKEAVTNKFKHIKKFQFKLPSRF
jgi:myosin heavy subunit